MNSSTSSDDEDADVYGRGCWTTKSDESSTSNNENDDHDTGEEDDDPGIRQLYCLSDGWLELESDPGLFTLLIRDFGCPDAEVEEIYDLQKPILDEVYGFIFLFNIVEERKKRSSSGGGGGGGGGGSSGSNSNVIINKISPSSLLTGDYIMDDDFLNQVFFAHQKVPNSCATHAILSILLNCPRLNIGPTLKRLKEYTKGMSPDDKGYSISNMPELAKAHNSHAAFVPEESEPLTKSSANSSQRQSQRVSTNGGEAYHFVSFVPIKGHLIELDGLKEFPIDHGPIGPKESWTEKFRELVKKRIEASTNSVNVDDIHYNLMAVIPNRYHRLRRSLQRMEFNRLTLLRILHFIEFYSTVDIYEEHNYCKAKYQSPMPNRLDSNSFLDKTTFSIKNIPHENAENPSEDADSCSDDTETASEASSSYNFSYKEEDYYDENGDLIQKPDRNECHQIFICKFEWETSEICSADNKSKENGHVNSIELEKKLKSESDSAQKETISRLLEDIESEIEEQQYHNDKKPIEKEIKTDKVESKTNLQSLSNDGLERRNVEYNLLETLLYKFRLFKTNHTTHAEFSINEKPSVMKDLAKLIQLLNEQILLYRFEFDNEKAKLERYELDDSRRTHNYDELIIAFLSMVSDQGLLEMFMAKELKNSVNYFPLSTTPVVSETKPTPSSCNPDDSTATSFDDESNNQTSQSSPVYSVKEELMVEMVQQVEETSKIIGFEATAESSIDPNSDSDSCTDSESTISVIEDSCIDQSTIFTPIHQAVLIKQAKLSSSSSHEQDQKSETISEEFEMNTNKFEDDDTLMEDIKDLNPNHKSIMNGFFPKNLTICDSKRKMTNRNDEDDQDFETDSETDDEELESDSDDDDDDDQDEE